MEVWLEEYLESEKYSGFQNNNLNLPNRRIQQIDWIPDNKYSVNLSYNQLSTLPDLHAYIEYLHLSNNKLVFLPLLPKRLVYLSIDGNPLRELPSLPKSLKVLRASFCSLTQLNELPKKLEYVYLGYNHLIKLPELAEGLHTLDIQYNDIYELPYLPDSLQILRLQGNPRLERYIGKKLPEVREMIKQLIASKRCRVYKEELMMVTWHPLRLQKWIDLGLDIDDM
jgi:hypothetical protein